MESFKVRLQHLDLGCYLGIASNDCFDAVPGVKDRSMVLVQVPAYGGERGLLGQLDGKVNHDKAGKTSVGPSAGPPDGLYRDPIVRRDGL